MIFQFSCTIPGHHYYPDRVVCALPNHHNFSCTTLKNKMPPVVIFRDLLYALGAVGKPIVCLSKLDVVNMLSSTRTRY